MSTIGLEISTEDQARTLRQLKKQRKQIEISQNNKKFAKQKLGVHGVELPPCASNQSQFADAKFKMAYD